MKARPFEMRRVRSLLASAALVALLGACGGDPTPTTASTPAPTPTPCTQSTVFQGAGQLPASFLDVETFSTAASGRLDVTVDWTFAASPIGVYVVPTNSCSLAQFNARTCNFLLRSDSGAKPRKVSVGSMTAGTYDLLLGNFANQNESLSALVVLSSGACPPVAAATAAREESHAEVGGGARGLLR